MLKARRLEHLSKGNFNEEVELARSTQVSKGPSNSSVQRCGRITSLRRLLENVNREDISTSSLFTELYSIFLF
jgi:hypothetical protein